MRVLLTSLLVLIGTAVWAQADAAPGRAPRWTARGQFAGLQGAGSVGLLWNVPDGRLQLGALYGHAPAVNGAKPFHAAVLRVAGSWWPMQKPQAGRWTISPTAAVSALFDLSGTAFYALPPEYPKGYYCPQAVHGLLAVGGRVGRIHPGGSVAFTAEVVALDTYLWYALSQRTVGLHEPWSLALGLELSF
jgi:hypothetical protein